MDSKTILQKYLDFYKERGHQQIPNVSLCPKDDSTLLFVNSGMFPLVPYLSGESHPLGKRLVNIQRSLRFEDIEEVGHSNRHTTCFHMLGNWSLGDYFKKEQLNWVYELFVEELGLDINKMYASVFEGDEYAPKDEESIKLLHEIFAKYGVEANVGGRIFAYGKDVNWWQRGDAVGELGGPDSEIYYYIGDDGDGLGKNPDDYQDEFIEIGNNVFMQYVKTEKGWEPLPQKNVDFGGGFERLALVVQGKNDIYETDNFYPIIQKIEALSGKSYQDDPETTMAMRVLADHIRSATFIAMDGVEPSNKDQGYALRRFLRRMVRYARQLGIDKSVSPELVPTVTNKFEWLYPGLKDQGSQICELFSAEEEKFAKTLEKSERKVNRRLDKIEQQGKAQVVDWVSVAFDLYQTLGYPPEMFIDDIKGRGYEIDYAEFSKAYDQLFARHKEQSRAGGEQKFKGGLADQSEQVVRYHTTTHILHCGLRNILGEDVVQRGSNITGERLRFDFNYDQKLTDDQIKKVEDFANELITKKLPVNFEMMDKDEALKSGAIHAFGEDYPDQVKVYFVGESLKDAKSMEFCGGPHVNSTSDLNPITIYKQESVGKGIRRIYARELPK